MLRAGAEGVNEALAHGDPLVLVAGTEPLSDYGARWPLLAHPNRFPNGTGAPPAGMREADWVRLQLRRWYPRDDHSGQAPHFVLDMFDRLQRHEVNTAVRQHLQIHPHLVQRVQRMTYEQVLEALELLALGLRGQELATRVRAAPAVVADLVHGVRISTSKLAGTAASAGSLRSRAYGLWVLYGPPTVSITINPSNINTQEFYELCGHGYSFDADGTPVDRPAASERWQLVTGHPVAGAQCFDAAMRAFFETYVGWRFGEEQQRNSGCLFGRTHAWFIKPETTQRGELHAHISLWQHAFHPSRLRAALTADATRPAVLRFMEGIQVQGLSSPILCGVVQPVQDEQHAGPEEPASHRQPQPQPQQQRHQQKAGRPAQAAPQAPPRWPCSCAPGRHPVHAECQHRVELRHLRDALQVVQRRTQQEAAHMCRCPLSADDPDPERTATFLAEAALEVLVHDHLTGTCTAPHIPARDENCRLRYPRQLHWQSTLDPPTGCVHLKRYGHSLVTHIPSFLLALPCNHTVTFACEVSRVLRAQEVWDKRHPDRSKDDPQRPSLQRIEAMAAELADYALKYNTKAESSEGAAGQLAAVLLLKMQQRGTLLRTGEDTSPTITAVAEQAEAAPTSAQEVQEAAERTAIEQQSAAQRALRTRREGYRAAHFNLAHACNVSTAHTTLPAPLAALALLNGQTHYESYKSQFIDYRLFTNALLPGSTSGIAAALPVDVAFLPPEDEPSGSAGPSSATAGTPADAGAATPSRTVQVVTRVTDYLYRGAPLAHLSPMLLFMFYYKVRTALDCLNASALGSLLPLLTLLLPPLCVLSQRKLRAGEDTAPHPLHPLHPQALTHTWAQRQRFAVPQPITDAPVRPAIATAGEQARDIYAAFALGNFAAYSVDAQLDLSKGLWSAYEAYFDEEDPAPSLELRVARQMLDNIDSLALTRAHADERRLQLQRLDRDVLQHTEDALLDHVPGDEYGVDAVEEEEDPTATRSALRHAARPDETLWSSQPSSSETCARLHSTYLHPPCAAASRSTKERHYIEAALQALPTPPTAAPSPEGPHPHTIRSGSTFTSHVIQETFDHQDRYQVLGADLEQQQHMRLVNRGQPNVHAEAFVLERPPVTYPTPAPDCQPPPYILLPLDQLPSIEDTVRLFTLSDEQARVFVIYARLLLAEKAGQAQPPFNAILTGYAGTGKSHVFDALLWFAYQHRAHQMIAVVSYTWRAALHDTTPGNVGLTTTTFFGIHRAQQSETTKMNVAAHMRLVKFIFLDEFSCMSPPHWARICAAVHNVRSTSAQPEYLQAPLADLHSITAGDPRQLLQPGAEPLYIGAAALNQLAQATTRTTASTGASTSTQTAQQPTESPLVQALKLLRQHRGDSIEIGVQLWHSIPHAFLLTKPFRQQDTATHPNLLEIAEIFSGLADVPAEAVNAACDVLNARTLTQRDLQTAPAPYIVVLRHSLRLALLPHLYRLHAADARQPLLLWRSTDLAPDGTPLPTEYLQELERLGGSDNDGGVPAICAFFYGVRYNLTTTVNPTLHHVHNNTATGTGLILDPREGPIPADAVVHVLSYPPRAVIVKPDGLSDGYVLPNLLASRRRQSPVL